jgi:TonB family protein
MKGKLAVAAVAAAGSAWAQAPAQATPANAPAASEGRLITNPEWLRKPGPEELSYYWPSGALTSGSVTLSCTVTEEGRLVDCRTSDEYPSGLGFGAAALKISQFFQMKPKMVDGKPVGGGAFSTHIVFNFADHIELPRMLRQPTDSEIEAAWPERARGIPGSALLQCDVKGDGKPRNCWVKRENPPHLGFGAAALKLAGSYRLTDPTPEGTDTAEVRVHVLIPIEFALPAPTKPGG